METIDKLIGMGLLPLLLIAAALLIRLLIGRRRFYRRGLGGLQHFSNYGRAVLVTTIENLLLWLSKLMFIAALLVFIFKLLS